ncbi:MAG: alpha/beta hydrolase [Chitinophagaceae bacterium]
MNYILDYLLSKKENYRFPLTPADSTPSNCYWDLRDPIFASSDIVKTGKIWYGKNDPPNTIPNYYDVSYDGDEVSPGFDDYNNDDEDLQACTNVDGCSQIGSSLFYYVYYPKHNYRVKKLYAFVLFHAGGFSDCSGPNYEDSLCRTMARKGFIVFNVEYRRGRIKDPTLPIGKYTSVQQYEAFYRGVQDGRGSIRSIIYDQQQHSDVLPYLFVEDSIFVAGQSAGGNIAANLAYYPTPAMNDSIFQTPAGLRSITTALGPVDADFYKGAPSIEYHSKIVGTCEMWSGFPFTITTSNNDDEYNFLTQNGTYTPAPMIAFMGQLDVVFPIKKKSQNVYFSMLTLDTLYNSDNRCMIDPPYKIYGDGRNKDGRIECTNDIYKLFRANNIPTLFYLECTMGHGLDRGDDDPITPYLTNFGLPDTVDLNAVNDYIAARTAFFFQSILNGTAGSLGGTSKFVHCVDSRHSSGTCATAAESPGCYQSDTCAKIIHN